MTFIEPGTPVPPPFNVIPSPRNVWRAILWLCRRSDLKHFLPHEGKEVRYAAVQVKGLIVVGSIHPLALHVCRAGKEVNYCGFRPSSRSPCLPCR